MIKCNSIMRHHPHQIYHPLHLALAAESNDYYLQKEIFCNCRRSNSEHNIAWISMPLCASE
jgi:hypothetical protein